MNIEEYCRKQSVECENEILRAICKNCILLFNPIKEHHCQNNIKETTFYKRKVKIFYNDGKTSIGLIDSDGFDIKIPNDKMEFVLSADGFDYYWYNNHLYCKQMESRFVKVINDKNYNEHNANINIVKDYLEKNIKIDGIK